MENLNIWAWVLMVMQVLGLGMVIGMFGKPQRNYGWASIIGALISMVLLWKALRVI